MTEEPALPQQTTAQFRWLVAALRDEPHPASREQREDLARRLEQALAGAAPELKARLGAVLMRSDGSLLFELARWHEEESYASRPGPEQASHRGRAHRYREISQIMRLWV